MEGVLKELVQFFKTEVQSDVKDIKKEQDDHETRIRLLESDNIGNKKDIASMNITLTAIQKNTTWILRLIIGTIVVGLLALLARTPT